MAPKFLKLKKTFKFCYLKLHALTFVPQSLIHDETKCPEQSCLPPSLPFELVLIIEIHSIRS